MQDNKYEKLIMERSEDYQIKLKKMLNIFVVIILFDLSVIILAIINKDILNVEVIFILSSIISIICFVTAELYTSKQHIDRYEKYTTAIKVTDEYKQIKLADNNFKEKLNAMTEPFFKQLTDMNDGYYYQNRVKQLHEMFVKFGNSY
jgi:hypothetical protein